ncbi:hypothetical protein BJ684DRAFT_22109 [Piptocephalis cylindrospora]|uniref:Uncharacterized protein n=1 Tax=Piptocephalis cylindrospora TaxID=1907219 RepID=A0A4P9XY87_9FUNG|nr:hypothetical protein BJ684DRAFT_22109 [Piptocephalis cylindrospora]|eukprot:RKP11337.1 hypothetical protein BJ684DRAFT_22109 [Piptocephalis cylindrospora]
MPPPGPLHPIHLDPSPRKSPPLLPPLPRRTLPLLRATSSTPEPKGASQTITSLKEDLATPPPKGTRTEGKKKGAKGSATTTTEVPVPPVTKTPVRTRRSSTPPAPAMEGTSPSQPIRRTRSREGSTEPPRRTRSREGSAEPSRRSSRLRGSTPEPDASLGPVTRRRPTSITRKRSSMTEEDFDMCDIKEKDETKDKEEVNEKEKANEKETPSTKSKKVKDQPKKKAEQGPDEKQEERKSFGLFDRAAARVRQAFTAVVGTGASDEEEIKEPKGRTRKSGKSAYGVSASMPIPSPMADRSSLPGKYIVFGDSDDDDNDDGEMEEEGKVASEQKDQDESDEEAPEEASFKSSRTRALERVKAAQMAAEAQAALDRQRRKEAEDARKEAQKEKKLRIEAQLSTEAAPVVGGLPLSILKEVEEEEKEVKEAIGSTGKPLAGIKRIFDQDEGTRTEEKKKKKKKHVMSKEEARLKASRKAA